MAYIAMANIVVEYMVVAHIVMAYIGMAHIVTHMATFMFF